MYAPMEGSLTENNDKRDSLAYNEKDEVTKLGYLNAVVGNRRGIKK